jgi:polyisoprenoid-binding protein YceI
MNMKTPLITLAALLALAAPAAAAPTAYEFGTGSEVDYFVVHPMHHVKGVTHTVRGKVLVENDHLVTPLALEIPLVSFKSGNANRDANAYNTLGVSAFPSVKLNVTKFTETGRTVRGKAIHLTGKATGALTLHGITRTVEVPIDATIDGKSLTVDAAFSVLLTTYGIERPALLFKPVEDEVKVTVHAEAAAR